MNDTYRTETIDGQTIGIHHGRPEPTIADDLRQAMNDWDAATPEQREEALAISARGAEQAMRTLTAADRRRHNDLGFEAFRRAGELADAGRHADAADLFREAGAHFARAAGDGSPDGTPCEACGAPAPDHDDGCPCGPDAPGDDAQDGPEDPWNNDPAYLRHLITEEAEALADGRVTQEGLGDLIATLHTRAHTCAAIADLYEAAPCTAPKLSRDTDRCRCGAEWVWHDSAIRYGCAAEANPQPDPETDEDEEC